MTNLFNEFSFLIKESTDLHYLFNIIIEVQLSDGSLKSKLRKANKDKADFAIIIGDEELKNKTLVLKPLKENDSDQKILSIEDAKKFISSLN